ncbi:MAG TPA: trigger factor, partial [Thermomicrobiales bacterium]|nr:trigger factor [Thermomicrobiales bacterium]
MKLTVERKPASLVVLDITADDEEFSEAMSKAFRKVARDIQVPGFRKGKAPRHIIEGLYGRNVFLQEAADEVMDKLYRQALQQEDLTPVGEPSVEINALEPVNFVVTVPVYPEVELNDYAGVRVESVDASVTDADVDEVLSRLQKSQGEWIDLAEPRMPAEGDQVTVDYEVELDGEPFQEPIEDAVFVLGETNLLVSLREKLESMNVGETDSFELAFDEDDESADPSIRGKSLSYKVTLKTIKERKLPALDDEFAKQVNDSESLDALRDQIRNDIHSSKTTESRTDVVNKVVDEMASQAAIDAPDVMVDEEVEHQLNHLKEDLQRSNTPWQGYLRIQGKTEDEVRADLRPEAARRLRNSLFLQAVARKEEVTVTDADIDAEIANLTGAFSPRDDSEEARKMAESMAQFYQSDYYRNMLRNQVFERKLTDRLIEVATEGKGAVTNPYVAPIVDISEVMADAASNDEASLAIEAEESDGGTDLPGEDNLVEVETTDGAGETSATSGDEPGYANAMKGDGTNDVPDGYPIKGNADSMIYHTPTSSSYGNTIAEWYFATTEAAEAAGFRAPAS